MRFSVVRGCQNRKTSSYGFDSSWAFKAHVKCQCGIIGNCSFLSFLTAKDTLLHTNISNAAIVQRALLFRTTNAFFLCVHVQIDFKCLCFIFSLPNFTCKHTQWHRELLRVFFVYSMRIRSNFSHESRFRR